ncbi:hypothetical protein D8674_005405 [Pyrus ussuriensis x Pyrus communis]|uniref:Uncharacterized protein n=1 Tax=Pyrus ussuriensis x Pyrus communis TaxID=2448454 RepID=A0A5N5FRC9_9ROSA|nr:hypothetical protein D8674_005405 [Pyrus ussuriensis x Pyrus communis]
MATADSDDVGVLGEVAASLCWACDPFGRKLEEFGGEVWVGGSSKSTVKELVRRSGGVIGRGRFLAGVVSEMGPRGAALLGLR